MKMATTTIRMFVTNMEANVALRYSGWFFRRSGPSWTPFRTSALIMTAAALPPGMPSESRGTMEPPVAALFAVSEAAMPSMMPVPNFSGYFESFVSVE